MSERWSTWFTLQLPTLIHLQEITDAQCNEKCDRGRDEKGDEKGNEKCNQEYNKGSLISEHPVRFTTHPCRRGHVDYGQLAPRDIGKNLRF